MNEKIKITDQVSIVVDRSLAQWESAIEPYYTILAGTTIKFTKAVKLRFVEEATGMEVTFNE